MTQQAFRLLLAAIIREGDVAFPTNNTYPCPGMAYPAVACQESAPQRQCLQTSFPALDGQRVVQRSLQCTKIRCLPAECLVYRHFKLPEPLWHSLCFQLTAQLHKAPSASAQAASLAPAAPCLIYLMYDLDKKSLNHTESAATTAVADTEDRCCFRDAHSICLVLSTLYDCMDHMAELELLDRQR